MSDNNNPTFGLIQILFLGFLVFISATFIYKVMEEDVSTPSTEHESSHEEKVAKSDAVMTNDVDQLKEELAIEKAKNKALQSQLEELTKSLVDAQMKLNRVKDIIKRDGQEGQTSHTN